MDQKKIAGVRAADYIKNGMTVGLGTGSTAFYMIERVGELVRQGLKIKAIATSYETAKLADKFNIPLIDLNEVHTIDLVIDGVDEIDPDFNAIKGGGGALFREKMVAKAAKEVIWIMDSTKRVEVLGKFPLPVEILPYGYKHVIRKMEEYGFRPVLRRKGNEIFITDNHNYIVDLNKGKPLNIKEITAKLEQITGVLETGLFLKLCNRIIVGTDSGVEIIEYPVKQ